MDTAINGGSLSDNLEAALLNSSVNAAHGFAASEIKLALNNDILRIISQAAAGCVAGELKRAECEAGAIGSGVGELAAEIMLDGRNPTFVDDKELQNIIELSKFIAGVSAAYAGYDVNVAIGAANTTVINNGVKDKALLKLENARKYLDDKSKQVLDKFIDAYKKGDIELAKKYKTQLDDAISDWASSGSYEILGVNPKAAVGAAVFAVGELVIPTNVVDVVPVGKLGKATKALGAVSPEIKIIDKIRSTRPTRYAYLTDQQFYLKIQQTMEGQKVSVNSGKTLYLSPDKKDILIIDPNNPLGGTIFPNDRTSSKTNEYIRQFIIDNGGTKF